MGLVRLSDIGSIVGLVMQGQTCLVMKSIHLRYFLIVKIYLNVLLYLQILYRRLNAIRILTRLFYFKLALRKKEILKMQNRHKIHEI